MARMFPAVKLICYVDMSGTMAEYTYQYNYYYAYILLAPKVL
jgi:hypothetical protein